MMRDLTLGRLACMFSQILAASLNQSVVAGRAIKTVATTVAVHRANTHLEVWRHRHAHGSIGRFIPRVPWSGSSECPAQEGPESAFAQSDPGERVPGAANPAGNDTGGDGNHRIGGESVKSGEHHQQWERKQPHGGGRP